MRRAGYWLIACLGLGLAGVAPTWADDDHDHDDDHERARALLQQGRVVPLEVLLQRVRADYPAAQVLEIELEEEDGFYYYEVELLTASGEVVELELDAAAPPPPAALAAPPIPE